MLLSINENIKVTTPINVQKMCSSIEKEFTSMTLTGVSGCGMEIFIPFVGKFNSAKTYFSLSEWIPEWVNSTAHNFKVNMRWINSQF